MFSSSTTATPGPTLFQTYLLPSIPFRRRQSSVSTLPSFSPRQSVFDSPSLATSPISPITPGSPGDVRSYSGSRFGHHRVNSGASGYEYDFHTTTSPPPGWSRHDSLDPAELSPGSPARPSYLSGHLSHISCAKCHADLAMTSQIISKGFTGRHGRAYLVAPSAGAAGAPSLPNTNTHKPVPRHLVTGLHTVADISCAVCGLVVGWKYVAAEEETQRYKVGKFILETRRCSVGACWEMQSPVGRGVVAGSPEAEDDGWVFGGAEMDGVDGVRAGAGPRRASAKSERRRRSSAARNPVASNRKGREIEDLYGNDDGDEDDRSGGEDDEEIMFDSQDEDECEDLFAGIWSPALAKRRRESRGPLAR